MFVLNNTYDIDDFDSPLTQHIYESQNKYESGTNTKLLT